jgi:2-polyprenyl-6-methoxyphenol hydroxylase-like FAD-dependent oxidoreductase
VRSDQQSHSEAHRRLHYSIPSIGPPCVRCHICPHARLGDAGGPVKILRIHALDASNLVAAARVGRPAVCKPGAKVDAGAQARAPDVRLFDVAVIGAGPGGLIAGLLLSRSRCHVAIFESGPSFERTYRGETLTPGTLRILDDIGLRDQVRALGGADPAGILLAVRGSVYEIDLVRDPRRRVRQVPQSSLLELLADEARNAGALVQLGTRVRGIIREGDRTAGITIVHDQGLERIGTRVVIAADGRFSVARRDARIQLRERGVPFDLVWASGRGGGRHVQVIVDERDVFVAFPTAQHGAQIGWLIPKGSYASLRAGGIDAIRARIARALAASPEPIEATITGFADLSLLPTVSQIARRWTAPGLLLIGDAAHPMSPVGGQGINVAIADAVVAARTIAVPIREGAPDAQIDAALRAVELERAPAVKRIARQQNLLPQMLHRLGAERTLAVLGPLAQHLSRSGKIPPQVRAIVDRFLLGDPPVRANHGPWMTTPVPTKFL